MQNLILPALSLSLFMSLSMSLNCEAQELEIVKTPEAFTALNADTLAAGKVYYQYTEQPPAFTDWMAASPVEYEFLSLFPDYVEPTLLTRKKKIPVTEKLTMFVAKAKTVINKSPANVNMKSFIDINFIKKLDAEIRHAAITPAQTMPLLAGKGNVTNFKQLCNTDAEHIVRPAFELSLEKLNRPGQPWCADTSRSICVESCYIFNSGYRTVVKGYNNFKAENEYDKKDQGMATQSEIRYFVSEAEMGKRQSVAALTGIDTPVRGALEQNIFYFNQLVQYGKIVAFFQEHPRDASKTIVTSFLVFGLQTSTWEKEYSIMGLKLQVREIMMGRGGGLNTATGITAGLPIYTQNIAKSLSKLIEN
ncbi:MAG: hypothetical protein HC883_02165 [Bdellovibrionaceae bacterium]|nr:hypothetical protein [Pseudobdellovibrionaceae bacterium]